MSTGYSRQRVLQFVLLLVALVIAGQLFHIQIIDQDYKSSARNNTMRDMVQYPPRGEIYDRNGEFLAQSIEVYDLMVVPRDVEPFDTTYLAGTVGVSIEEVRAALKKAADYSRRKPSILFKQLPKAVKLRLEEKNIPGFYTQYRTSRTYPRKIAGNLLGYINEVNEAALRRDSYYKMGDYIGTTGIERAYETYLRGEKGVKVELVDVFGMPKGSYEGGRYDPLPVPGRAITCTIDAGLQEYVESLLAGKVASVVAVEPATGEVLVMASSPGYDPDKLVGRELSSNFAQLDRNPRRPLFNRSVQAGYPPGSTFKVVTGLIGLQEGVVVPGDTHVCVGGYPLGRGVKCHNHISPLNMIEATAQSCNAYFCYVLRDILDNKKYDGIMRGGFDVWNDYVQSFGFGRRLDSDFRDELPGSIPTSAFYNERYHNMWNSLTVISLAIGQGELLTTPMQMANLAATIANRGHYYIPHVVKQIEGQDSIDQRFYEKHYTKVSPEHFEPIVEGMYQAVNVGTAWMAKIPGIDMCGKTGTAQNPQGADHSTFLCFAPRDNPKIAVSVYVEHGGWGASVAVPIASLLVEKYLTGQVSRPWIEERIKNLDISYATTYDRIQ